MGLPVTDPWVRALTLTVGKKKKKDRPSASESRFRAAELLGFPQFAHCYLEFFDTAAARVKCCQDDGKSLLRRTSPKVTLGWLPRTRHASEPAGKLAVLSDTFPKPSSQKLRQKLKVPRLKHSLLRSAAFFKMLHS